MSSHQHITPFDIEKAKETCVYSVKPFHEHDDSIRIAYEWLDAQIPVKKCRMRVLPLKHIIESWGGRYVSQSDVEVAVHLHPHFKGEYPYYNFSTKLVEPDVKRLDQISGAFTQARYRESHDPGLYHTKEQEFQSGN